MTEQLAYNGEASLPPAERANEFLSSREQTFLDNQLLPLQSYVENNEWHHQESVARHSERVVEAIIVSLESPASLQLSAYLSEPIGDRSRESLLLMATYLHDIGKQTTLQEEEGKTSATGHESESVRLAAEVIDELALTPEQEDYILTIIGAHGTFSDVIDPNRPEYETGVEQFRTQTGDAFLGVTLLGMADLQGSHWGSSNPEDYAVRIARCRTLLGADTPDESEQMTLL